MSETEVVLVSGLVSLIVVFACQLWFMWDQGRVDEELRQERLAAIREASLDLDPGIQESAYRERHDEHEHEAEILDGVDTCLLCGAIRLPDETWMALP